jgi:hypothetical protein
MPYLTRPRSPRPVLSRSFVLRIDDYEFADCSYHVVRLGHVLFPRSRTFWIMSDILALNLYLYIRAVGRRLRVLLSFDISGIPLPFYTSVCLRPSQRFSG